MNMVCEALELARSTYYYRSERQEDNVLNQAIEHVAETWPRYGYRRVTEQLKREGWNINSKKVRRLMGENGPFGQEKGSQTTYDAQ